MSQAKASSEPALSCSIHADSSERIPIAVARLPTAVPACMQEAPPTLTGSNHKLRVTGTVPPAAECLAHSISLDTRAENKVPHAAGKSLLEKGITRVKPKRAFCLLRSRVLVFWRGFRGRLLCRSLLLRLARRGLRGPIINYGLVALCCRSGFRRPPLCH